MDQLTHSRSKRKYSLNDQYFKTYSNNMAYILGLWYADGSICPSPSTGKLYEFNITSDIESLYLLQLIMKELNCNTPLKIHKRTESPVLKIFSIPLCQSIIELGGTDKKSSRLKYPNLPDEYFPHFLRGYFDGDGCIHQITNKPSQFQLTITSGTLSFLQELEKRILNIDASIKMRFTDYKTWHVLSCSKKSSYKLGQIMYGCLGHNLENPFYMERKFKKFLILHEIIENAHLYDGRQNNMKSEKNKVIIKEIPKI